MPTISTRCPSCCKDIDLVEGEGALLGGSDGEPVAYAFVCPLCNEPTVRRVGPRGVQLLLAGGISAEGVMEDALRRSHPEEPPAGPAFTFDDLLDFHLLLDHAGWFERLANLVP